MAPRISNDQPLTEVGTRPRNDAPLTDVIISSNSVLMDRISNRISNNAPLGAATVARPSNNGAIQ